MPNRLSKLFSSSEAKEKEALAETDRNRSNDSPPPGYQEQPPDYDRENILNPPDITAGFNNLHISESKNGFPQPEEAIAHLKVLECFYRLKQSVGSRDGLFGINDKVVTGHGLPQTDNISELLANLAEKRWAIYLQRAVDRFEVWWNAVTPNARMIDRGTLERSGKAGTLLKPAHMNGQAIMLDMTNIPPADVLMVWHSYMLNPRAYLEDCIRYGRMPLWHTPMPWQVVSQCINSETFAFEATPEAQASFTSLTGLPWHNLEDVNSKRVICPSCNMQDNWAAWTTCFDYAPSTQITNEKVLGGVIDDMLSSGRGFCDKDFRLQCRNCLERFTHERLRSGKFCNDMKKLIHDDVPLGGTCLGHEGIPYTAFGKRDITSEVVNVVCNDLFKKGLSQTIISKQASSTQTVNEIRDAVEAAMNDRAYMRKVRSSHSYRMQRSERIGVRKIMSRYWENSSPFALDLVGAVIRQGSFVEKMHNIDWLHSPALPSTMARLIKKYQVFLQIMASTPTRMAVPTLDVDLAWHTHQLSPHEYMKFTVELTRQFIDHDDKVAETKLNDSFAWTSKTYQRMTGQPYSECTCWYCEAIRESHTSTASRLFSTTSARAEEMLHSSSQDPRKSVHISAHNAIRPRDASDPIYSRESKARAAELEKHYLKACERAKKKGRPVPKRDDYYYSDAWGYPVYIPAYSPYVGFIPYAPMYYPVTPGCMAVGAGAIGNCCAGTCGGGVAAGACGAGGCAGGAAGGCGGGGGGGGCGGGGGGGGGGCGGGGGG
ncbi:Hypothetical predicted protein [Lecanosticta acicola]|uniref:Uncharacterized protein n=1 Tax=Lecanosticta acicola TaxID=111012 RepID=A0AAI9E7V8_9PEZI|nr:Hypothetical predicted protein [Lecanosticta acicola]